MTGHDSTQARAEFAERLRVEAPIRSDALVRGVSKVAREQFVGPGPWKILRPSEIQKGYETTPDDNPRHIYDTVLVALDHTRNLNNGEPSCLLLWLDSLDLNRGDSFLHVGCGVGYYTAIAAEAVGSEGRVTGIEIDAQLARQAERNLGSYANVRVVAANGCSEIPSTFDAIFINAGCTHPQPSWLDQLAIGGRLLIPLTANSPMPNIGWGMMLLVIRRESSYEARFSSGVGIYHCEGSRTESNNDLLKASFVGQGHERVRRLRRDAHEPGSDCWLHGSGYCLSVS
jgi:protein-L-isoaspartate(D-aspartate) O-methyltransferase